MNSPDTEIMHGMGELGQSRSQKKRESTALQKQGETLAALAPNLLAGLGLSEDLDAAIRELRAMKKHEARRRQAQLIGRRMRELGAEERERIAAFLQNLDKRRQKEAGEMHRLEEWRAALLSEERREAALTEIVAACPAAEAGRLRHLAEAAAAERSGGKGVKAFRELFRYLRDCDGKSQE